MIYNEETIIQFLKNELKDLKEEKDSHVIYETNELIDIFNLTPDVLTNKKLLFETYSKLVEVAKKHGIPMAINGKMYDPEDENEGILDLDYGDLEPWLSLGNGFEHPLSGEIIDILNNEYRLKLSMWIFNV
jgi:hypothetical protein